MPVELLYYKPGPEAPIHLGYARDSLEGAIEDLPHKYPVTHIGGIRYAFGENLAGTPGIIIQNTPVRRDVVSSVFGIMNLCAGDKRIHLGKPHDIRYRPMLVSLVHNIMNNDKPELLEEIILFGKHYLPVLELDKQKFPRDYAQKRTNLLSTIFDYLGECREEDSVNLEPDARRHANGHLGGVTQRYDARDSARL